MSQWVVCPPAWRFFVPCDRKLQRAYLGWARFIAGKKITFDFQNSVWVDAGVDAIFRSWE